jgi:uncharacterized membrane protein YhaH (DUF805 family)
MTLKVPERLDRETFWQWAVCLVIAHIVLTLLAMSGASFFGTVDTFAVIAIALVVGARFRDIGWPVWIGVTFVLVTMLGLPLVAAGYAIASHLNPPAFMEVMNVIGLLVGPVNLVLLIVAGSVPGTAAAISTEALISVFMSEPSAVAPDMMATAAPAPDPSQVSEGATPLPSSAAPAGSDMKGLLVVGGGGLVILLIVGSFIARTTPPAPVSPAPVNTARPSPPATYPQSNGLTKETNDFLQQLSRQQPARR